MATRLTASMAETLEACLGSHASASSRELDVTTFCDAVAAHRVVPQAMAWVARASDPAPQLQQALTDLHRRLVVFDMHAIATLAWWEKVLGPVPWLLLKGPAIQAAFDPSGETRAYSDLDVLIRPSDLRVALNHAIDAGATLVERDWAEIVQQDGGELQLIAPSSVVIDLHWHLHDGPNLRSGAVIETKDLFSRSTEIEIGHRRVRTLEAGDTLAHLARHAAASGGDRLIWYRDLDRVIRSPRLDHRVARERVEAHGALLASVVLLDRCRAFFGTPIPTELRPSGVQWAWVAIARTTRRLSGPPRVYDGRSLDRLLLRSVRHDTRSSLRSLWRKLVWVLRPGGTWRTFEPGSKTLEDLLGQVSGHQASASVVDTPPPTDVTDRRTGA